MRTLVKNLRPKGFLLLVVLLPAASIGAGSVRRPYGEVASKEVPGRLRLKTGAGPRRRRPRIIL
jgi:hypothetical protein